MTDEASIEEALPPKPRFDPNKELCEWVEDKWVVRYKFLVPEKVAMWAFKEAIAASGHIIAFNQAIKELQEPDRAIAINRWVARRTMERSSDLTKRLKKAVGLTQKQLNDIFMDALLLQQKDEA